MEGRTCFEHLTIEENLLTALIPLGTGKGATLPLIGDGGNKLFQRLRRTPQSQ